jgi:hypothetical protein
VREKLTDFSSVPLDKNENVATVQNEKKYFSPHRRHPLS